MTDLGALSQGGVEMNKSRANIVDLNNMVCPFVRASYVIKEVLAKALSCVFLWLTFCTLAHSVFFKGYQIVYAWRPQAKPKLIKVLISIQSNCLIISAQHFGKLFF